MASDLPPKAKNVVNYAERIAAALYSWLLVCVAAIGARFFGVDTITWESVTIPLGYTAAVIGIITVGHAFWTYFLLQDLLKFQKSLLSKERENPTNMLESRISMQKLFNEIYNNKKLFLGGLRPRTFRAGSRIVRMSIRDPTTWWSWFLILLTPVAIIPWRVDNGLRWASPEAIIVFTGIALILVVINWWLGGLWIISLSQLTKDPSTNIENIESARDKPGNLGWRIITTSFCFGILTAVIIGASYLFHAKVATVLMIAASVVIIPTAIILLLVLFTKAPALPPPRVSPQRGKGFYAKGIWFGEDEDEDEDAELPLAPAGWYHDGLSAGRKRYFDGSEWTEHYEYPVSQAGWYNDPKDPTFWPDRKRYFDGSQWTERTYTYPLSQDDDESSTTGEIKPRKDESGKPAGS